MTHPLVSAGPNEQEHCYNVVPVPHPDLTAPVGTPCSRGRGSEEWSSERKWAGLPGQLDHTLLQPVRIYMYL